MSIDVHLRIALDRDGCLRKVSVDQRFEFCESRGDGLERGRRLYEHARGDHLAVVLLEPRGKLTTRRESEMPGAAVFVPNALAAVVGVLHAKDEAQRLSVGDCLVHEARTLGQGVEGVPVAGVALGRGRTVVSGALEMDEGCLLPEGANEAHRVHGGGGKGDLALELRKVAEVGADVRPLTWLRAGSGAKFEQDVLGDVGGRGRGFEGAWLVHADASFVAVFQHDGEPAVFGELLRALFEVRHESLG